jgi:hypothetical protein
VPGDHTRRKDHAENLWIRDVTEAYGALKVVVTRS